MFHAMERKELDTLYVIGENPAQSEADQNMAIAAAARPRHLIVQDIFLTKTGELAEVVLPGVGELVRSPKARSRAASAACSAAAKRSIRRARRATTSRSSASSRGVSVTTGRTTRRAQAWDECRSLSPWHAGMSYARLEALDGIQWPCYDETHPGELFLHARLWEDPVRGERAPFAAVEHDPPVEALDDEFPLRLTTGRRLDSFNTGVQSGGYASPLRRGETLDISPARRRALRRRRRRSRARHFAARLGGHSRSASMPACVPVWSS